MLSSWQNSGLPMPKRIQDLDLSLESEQQVASTSKSVNTLTSGSKIVVKPMRIADLLKFVDLDPSPAVTKARKQLWSVPKSGSKKHNEKFKKPAIKANVRKTIFPQTSTRRTATPKSNPADQTLPLIDMEDLEQHPRKLKQRLRIPQSTVNNKTTVNPGATRQTMYQTKFVKPTVKPNTETRSNTVNNPSKPVSKLKRQTVHQSCALKSIPKIRVTNCEDTHNTNSSETVHDAERESVHDLLKQILCRMDKLEMLVQENHRCSKCHRVISPCKPESTKETALENVENKENNTVQFVENIALCNNKTVENVTDTTIKQITIEKVTDNTVTEAKNNIENIENVTQIANSVLENAERETKYDNNNCVQNLFPKCIVEIEEVSTCDLNTEKPVADNILHKSHFELLEDQLQNNSLTSLAFIDSDDSGSPVFQEIDYNYLLGETGSDITEIQNGNGTPARNNSTGSNDAIRRYNEMRKCIPMLCTPKISRNNNASLMTPSVQNSHKKILSRRIQEQLLMLNKKS